MYQNFNVIFLLPIILWFVLCSNLYSEFWHCGDIKNPLWDNCILKNVRQFLAADKTYDIQLDYNEYKVDEDTELFLNFNNDIVSQLKDLTGHYSFRAIKYYQNPLIKIFDSNNAGFVFFDDIITIETKKGQFLSNNVDCGSFTIEFWLYPTSLQDLSTIFRRVGTISDEYSGIKIYIENKRMVFGFLNFFYDHSNRARSLYLKEGSELKTEQWHHHAVVFNRRTGKLTKYMDGVEEVSLYATVSGNPEDTILIPHFKTYETTDAYLGGNFFGYIDEFRISTVARSTFNTSIFVPDEGILLSQVFDTKNTGTIIKDIKYTAIISKTTAIDIKLRADDKIFSFSSQEPPWMQWKSKVKGRYFQYKITFIRKSDIDDTPVLKDVVIEYELDLPPEIPIGLSAKFGNGFVQLKWLENTDKDLAGYNIYYGKSPGIYEHKIDVGRTTSYTVRNLENGELYYFVVTAYDRAEPAHESKYSKEVWGRPSK